MNSGSDYSTQKKDKSCAEFAEQKNSWDALLRFLRNLCAHCAH